MDFLSHCSREVLDIRGGMRPDLTGLGFDAISINAGIDFGKKRFEPKKLRATIAAFNHPALKMCKKAGFALSQRFWAERTGKKFIVLVKEL